MIEMLVLLSWERSPKQNEHFVSLFVEAEVRQTLEFPVFSNKSFDPFSLKQVFPRKKNTSFIV